MKGKSLVAGILIVVLAAMSGMVWNSGNTQKLSAPAYGLLHTDGEYIVASLDNTLVWLDEHGHEKMALDLSDLGIRLAGDYGFLRAENSRNDLLVYHRDFEPDFWFNFKSYLRLQETVELTPRGRDGFYRCNIIAKQCHPFGKGIPRLDSSFRLAIDDRDNTVYLAHTSTFKLYKIDHSGNILAESKDGMFEFPNQIEIVGDALWVADTNHHRIAQLSTHTDTFAKLLGEFSAKLGGEHRFPHDFAVDASGERLWVVIGDNAMDNGRIASYKFDGELLGETTGAIGRDPLSIRYWKDVIWLGDLEQPKLQRLTVDKNSLNQLSALQSPTLARLEAQTRIKQAEGERLSHFGALGFILVLVGGFFAAWKLEKQKTLAAFARQLDLVVSAQPEATPNGNIFWISNKLDKRRKWLLRSMYAVGVGYVIASLILLLTSMSSPLVLWVVLAGVTVMTLSMMAGAYWLVVQLSKQKLGVIGQSIVLERNGRSTVARACDLHYSDHYLIFDGVIIALGNRRQRFFDTTELDRFVFPRLKEATRLSVIELYKTLWLARDPQFMFSIIVILCMALAGLGMQLLK